MKQTLLTIAALAACSLAMAADPEPVYSYTFSNGQTTSSGTGSGNLSNLFTPVQGQDYAQVSSGAWKVTLTDITEGPWTLTMTPYLTGVTSQDSTFLSLRTQYKNSYNFTLDANGNVGLKCMGGKINDLGVTKDQLNGGVSLTFVSDAAAGTADVYFVDLSDGSLVSEVNLTGITVPEQTGFDGIQFMTALDQGSPGTASGTMYVADFKVYAGKVVPASPAVPEPATATLSLLALAGLCARRRRKAA